MYISLSSCFYDPLVARFKPRSHHTFLLFLSRQKYSSILTFALFFHDKTPSPFLLFLSSICNNARHCGRCGSDCQLIVFTVILNEWFENWTDLASKYQGYIPVVALVNAQPYPSPPPSRNLPRIVPRHTSILPRLLFFSLSLLHSFFFNSCSRWFDGKKSDDYKRFP